MTITKQTPPVLFLCLMLALMWSNGCGGAARPDPPTPAPLSASNVNLVFVVSEDLAYQGSGDINPKTANLTNRGLQRSLLLGSYLKQQVLGSNNVTAVYALEPMTHLQTADNHPDMVAFETIQQFTLLNQVTLSRSSQGIGPYTANSYPLNVSYSTGPVPAEVVAPYIPCANCQGLDFRDQDGDNEGMVGSIITAKMPGYYVFSAPWETIGDLLAKINHLQGYGLAIPASYISSDYVYAISIAPSGSASLITYNANLRPGSSYPALPPHVIVGSACTEQAHFHIKVKGGENGAISPAGINTNETVYFIRHAEAHPVPSFEDGNYVCAGQWRTLNLPNALRGKIAPDIVYSIDPAQVIPGSENSAGDSNWSYVRTSLTVEPYAIANNLPYDLASSFSMAAQNPPQLATAASDFFFTGSKFSNRTVLVDWEHDHIPTTVNALLESFHGSKTAPNWPDDDYDTIWTVMLDADGNLSVDNAKCEGMQTKSLPKTCPQF